MPVRRLTGLLPWVLFNILLLFTGVSGQGSTVYSSLGDTANLPCNLPGSLNCSSTTWVWDNGRSKYTFELVAHGVVKDNNLEKSGRLRVGRDCSLHVNNLTTAEVGEYHCRLYDQDNKHKDADVIKLSLLKIFASSPVRIGSTVTLVCELLSPGTCGKGLRMNWVSETGAPLQGDRYKLSESECSSNLTVTLQRSDHNMTWRCQLTEEGKVKTSLSYTTIFPVSDENITEKEEKKEEERGVHIWIVSGVAVCVAVVLIVVLIMICRRRTVQRKMAGNHVSQSHTVTNQNKGESEDTVTYAVVNPSVCGKRKPNQESAVLETEYATIKTSQK